MIDCPICGRPVAVTQHQRGNNWTREQEWLVDKLRANGISQKAIARIMGCSAHDIANLAVSRRARPRQVA